MATGEAAQILDALLARCESLSISSPAIPIAYPEVAFTPPSPPKYLQISFFANKPAWEGLANGKLAQGLLQITVIWPRGAGLVDANEAAQQVIDHFAKGLVLIDHTGVVKITISTEPYTASPIFENSDLRIPVTIPWVATAI